jgi:hypothetical protein
VGDDGRASMQFGDGAEIDREYQLDILALAQAQVGRLDKHTRRTQVDGTAQPAATSRDCDVNRGAGAMPGVKSTFQGLQLRIFRFLSVVQRRLAQYASLGFSVAVDSTLIQSED